MTAPHELGRLEAPSSPRRFPDFLGIGAQKAGTTWIFENLRRHPAIWLPPIKELQYFNDLYVPSHRRWTGRHRHTHGSKILKQYVEHVPQERWNYRFIARLADITAGPISDEWYGSIFTLANENQLAGEISPGYALLPHAGIAHVLRLTPSVKILFSLRDPIERNWSHLRMIARNEPGIDLRRIAVNPDLEQQSNYPELIARWTALVPNERLLVLFADDMLNRPQEVMTTICRFLEIDFDLRYFPQLDARVHVGEPIPIPDDIYDLLRARVHPIYENMMKIYPEITKSWIAKHY